MRECPTRFKFTLGLLTTSLLFLSSCDTEQLEEDCAAGDETACQILETISAAVEELEDAVPSDLTLASAFEDAVGYSVSDKQGRLDEALDPDVIERDGLAACLRALPPPPPVRDPICYGPRMDYVNHPDFVSGQPAATGQLPQGDLGIWLDTEPTQSDAGTAPCSAVKMNELMSKAIHNIDMATGSVAMMMCAAAHERISAPRNNGDILNFADILNEVPNSPFTITTATLERIDANTLKSVLVADHNGGNENRMGLLSITTSHNHATRTGLVQIERTPQQGGNDRLVVTSARYQPDVSDETTLQLRVQQGRFLTSETDYYDTQGDVKLGPISGNPNRNIEDTHLLLAEFTSTTGEQKVAYGWNAGGNDSHYRVFNAEADTTTADAWYGYVPNPYGPSGSTTVGDTPDLDLSDTDAGMICNWAGPGNNHNVNTYLQHQSMTKDGQDRWILTNNGSLIQYVPTVACDLDTNAGNAEFTAVLPPNSNVHAASFAANDIGSSDTFDQDASAVIGMDAKSNHNVDLPEASW